MNDSQLPRFWNGGAFLFNRVLPSTRLIMTRCLSSAVFRALDFFCVLCRAAFCVDGRVDNAERLSPACNRRHRHHAIAKIPETKQKKEGNEKQKQTDRVSFGGSRSEYR